MKIPSADETLAPGLASFLKKRKKKLEKKIHALSQSFFEQLRTKSEYTKSEFTVSGRLINYHFNKQMIIILVTLNYI